MKKFIQELLGANRVTDFLGQLSRKIDRQNELINQNHKEAMAKLQQVLEAIDTLGVNLPQLVNAEVEQIGAMIRDRLSGTVNESDLDEVLTRLNKLGSTVGDAIIAIAPGLPSPTAPTPAADPVIIPTPVPVPVPDIEIPVDLTPADLGVPGGVAIDAQ